MIFKKHFELEGKHAFLSASSYSWLRYDKAKLVETYRNALAKEKGTELHEFASRAIKLEQPLKGNTRTIAMFVNDAINFRMESEQVLYYSPICFGTADAISFRNNKLRIHDLKTGTTKASFDQLKIYAALFCLEYSQRPGEIEMELRIYQNDTCKIDIPDPDEIAHIMDWIITADNIINHIDEED